MMKLKLIAFLLCISAIMSAQLQFGFGIKGGAETSTQNFEVGNIGYCYGAFVNIGYGRHLSFKPELLFYNLNHTVLENVTSNNDDVEPVNFKYRSIPLLLQLKLGRGFSLEGGPQFNVVTSSETSVSVGPQDYLSWVAGFNFHMGKSVHLTFRYMKGKDPYYIEQRTEYYNESFMVGLGISLFNLKERTFK